MKHRVKEKVLCAGLWCLGLSNLGLAAEAAKEAEEAAKERDNRPQLVICVGAAGSELYGEQFQKWAERWVAAADRGGATLFRIGGTDHAMTDRDRLKKILKDLPRQTATPLWIVLIGHGTFDGRQAKFNLRGPDLSAAELADWLQPFERPLVIVNCASSSAPFINRLSAPSRVIVTATKSGQEHNFARFGDYLSLAIADLTADLDKDDQVSILEAFLFASNRVAEFYEQAGRLATEHALIDDNGDKFGTRAEWFRGVRATKSPRNGAEVDGRYANRIHLVPNPRERRMSPVLRARRDELEIAVETLREQKLSLAEDAYYGQLETLLVELANIYRQSEAAVPKQDDADTAVDSPTE